jgi:hypothetical protein
MRRIAIVPAVALVALLGIGTAACTSAGPVQSGTQQEQKSSNDSENAAESTLPAPVFRYSEGRWVLTEAEASIALGVATTSFVFQQGDPNPVESCPSIGYPVANTAQLTNPDKIVNDPYAYQGEGQVVGNMDPYQYYTPSASEGTYVLCVSRTGTQYLLYAEPNVITVAGAATWVAGRGIVTAGSPHMPVCKVDNPGVLSGQNKASTVCSRG